jgi:hypothetical protein
MIRDTRKVPAGGIGHLAWYLRRENAHKNMSWFYSGDFIGAPFIG